jgi:hypothetical protein
VNRWSGLLGSGRYSLKKAQMMSTDLRASSTISLARCRRQATKSMRRDNILALPPADPHDESESPLPVICLSVLLFCTVAALSSTTAMLVHVLCHRLI